MVLEALVRGGASLDEGLPTRVALYRLFHTLQNGKAASEDSRSERADSPEARLQQLTPRPRQALLLNALESFSFRDIGAILGVSEADAERLAAEAQEEIERALVTDILVIEDEAMIALDVKELVEELGHRVTGIARTRAEAVRLAHRDPPGLVLADILLADESSGVDAARDILASIDTPVIFVTAYPERLLTGDISEPTYLLTKPFDRAALKATIGQALFFHEPRALSA
jgi:CheY-like chemotaxis protein